MRWLQEGHLPCQGRSQNSFSPCLSVSRADGMSFRTHPFPPPEKSRRNLATCFARTPSVVGKGTQVSASELLLMESLAMNSLRATSWMDQWLSALGKMIDRERHPNQMEMLLSGGKSLRYICQQQTALWAEIILKRRDAALSNPVPLTEEEKAKLRNSPLLSSDFLFSPELSREIVEERKRRRQESFLDSVVSLAKASSSRKVQGRQQQPGLHPKRKKKKSSPQGQPQQGQASNLAQTSDNRPFLGKTAKPPANAQGSAGKPKGRGRGRGRT